MTARGTERSGHYNDIGCFAEQEHSSRSKSWGRTSTHDDGNLCILSVASIQTEWAFIVLSFIEQCSSPRSRLFYIWFGFPCSTFPLLPSTTSTAYPRFSDFQSVPSSSSCTIRSSFFPDRSSGRVRRWNFSTSRYNKLTTTSVRRIPVWKPIILPLPRNKCEPAECGSCNIRILFIIPLQKRVTARRRDYRQSLGMGGEFVQKAKRR